MEHFLGQSNTRITGLLISYYKSIKVDSLLDIFLSPGYDKYDLMKVIGYTSMTS